MRLIVVLAVAVLPVLVSGANISSSSSSTAASELTDDRSRGRRPAALPHAAAAAGVDPVYPRVLPNTQLGCPARGCLVSPAGGGHRGCMAVNVSGLAQCAWGSVAAAKLGCMHWGGVYPTGCGGFWCEGATHSNAKTRCWARSWDSPLESGRSGTVYLRTPPAPPTPPPTPLPPDPPGFPPPSHPPPNSGGWTHGWDCVACDTNSMLSANIGTNDVTRFNASSPWWIKEIAARYAHIQMSPFLGADKYNDTVCTQECLRQGVDGCTCGESPFKTLARRLKQFNPRIKVQLYQASDRGELTPFGSRQLQAHPEWWMRDDSGEVVYMNPAWVCPPGCPGPSCDLSKINGTQQCHPVMDWRQPGYAEWFRTYPASLFGDDVAELFDGLMVDGAGYFPIVNWQDRSGNKNISVNTFKSWFSAEMRGLHDAQLSFSKLNNGLIFDNGGLPNPGTQPTFPGLSWRNVVGAVGSGSFLEWFGSFGQLTADGTWDVASMNSSFSTIMEAARAGYPVVLKAAPGPATTPFLRRGWGDDQGRLEHNGFFVTQWKGPAGPISNSSSANREGAAKYLVQSLAPFLIVVEPNVFWSYAWFYNLEDGYIPCPGTVTIDNLTMPIECGMPTQWYAEFERPLGPPLHPAKCTNGTVWTREFKHASVFLDLRDINKARITWHTNGTLKTGGHL